MKDLERKIIENMYPTARCAHAEFMNPKHVPQAPKSCAQEPQLALDMAWRHQK